MLDHLPPIPLRIDYGHTGVTIPERDELGIYDALRLHDRSRYIYLHPPPSVLQKCLVLMDERFPILEHLSLWSAANKTTILTGTLPEAFLAPSLRHLALTGIALPKGLPFLTSTLSLVTLILENVQPSSYFHPKLLVTRLQYLPQLKELSVGFSIRIPRPTSKAELELSGFQGTPVTLPNLKILRFHGVSTYLECLVAQIETPLLEQLDITLFSQNAFALISKNTSY
jgi:hypothetical protein